MTDSQLEQLSRRLHRFAQERDWEQFHSPKNLAMALSVEVAEIVEHFQWMTEEQSRDLDATRKAEVEQELADAKQNLIGGFPLRISSNAKIVEYLAMMGFYDYPLDWLDTLTTKLASVDVQQVRDAGGQRAGLAGTGARDHEHRSGSETPILVSRAEFGRFALCRVQHTQVIDFPFCQCHFTPREP